MVSLITWLWNIRHRKLIEETKTVIGLYQFLRYKRGLKVADKLSAGELKILLKMLDK